MTDRNDWRADVPELNEAPVASKGRRFNHYEIGKRLGSGGAGVVYSAHDSKLMRPVVLKMLHRGKASSDEVRRMILREARLASAIDHPNVCAIYEVCEADERAVIVMQYVPGRTLDELVASGPLSLQLVLSIGIQIGDGLAAAHGLGIVHRDLKPANVMVTDGGLVKILDFGTAKRTEDVSSARGGLRSHKSTPQRGTLAYMAPEQFVLGKTSERSDIFAFGVMLYEVIAGKHPFRPNAGAQAQLPRAIQYLDPPPLRGLRPDVTPELEAVVRRAMAKLPGERFDSAAEMRDVLKTLMRSMHFELGLIPGEASALLPTPGAEPDKRAGLFSLLTERFMRPTPAEPPANSVAVLPFVNLGGDETALYGFALSDAVATRLARLPSLVVRPASALAAVAHPHIDPREAGRKLLVGYVMTASFLHADAAFELNWQLLEVASGRLRAGGTIQVPSLSLVTIQNEICDEVFAALHGAGHLEHDAPEAAASRASAGDMDVSEDYLQARALLSNFALRSSHKGDLEAARGKFAEVTTRAPAFAPAHSGLGVTYLQAVRRGFGGLSDLLTAQRCFQRALECDPGLVEASLYRVETLLARGEKESARHGVLHLLETAGNDFEVRIVAGIILQRDGLYDHALTEFGAALRLNPAAATLVYNSRARVHHYQGQLDLAMQEIKKGLALDPQHALLRTSLGYLFLRLGDAAGAAATLERVVDEDPTMLMAHPTLAMCHLAAGDRARAAALITDAMLSAAEADCEMSYRLATYFALEGDAPEALHWLRRAIYLGNENYPWFASNPAWQSLHDNEDYVRLLTALKKTHRANLRRWSRLLHKGAAAPASDTTG